MSGHHDRLASFIDDVRKLILALHPSQKDYFEVFANEAGFGLSVIKEDINALPRGASILEVGAGLLHAATGALVEAEQGNPRFERPLDQLH